MFDTLKGYLINKIIEWLFHVAGGIFVTLGISTGSVAEFVGAGVTLLLGIIVGLLNHYKAVMSTPPVQSPASK